MNYLTWAWRRLIFWASWYLEYQIINKVEPVRLENGWHYKFTNRFTGKVKYNSFPMLALSRVGVSLTGEQRSKIGELVEAQKRVEAQRLILDHIKKELDDE